MLLLIIYWFAFIMLTDAEITFTEESFATDGKPCMTDCVNHTCITTWDGANDSCEPGEKPALKYYTAQFKSQTKWCSSRCVKHLNSHNVHKTIFDNEEEHRCYVSEDVWDYCSPERETEYSENWAITETHGICESECVNNGSSNGWCYYKWNLKDSCEPELYPYKKQSNTIHNRRCLSMCGKYHGSALNQCMDEDDELELCAPPAQDFTIFKKLFEKCEKTWYGVRRDKNDHSKKISFFGESDMCDGRLESGFVSNYAKSIEGLNKYLYTKAVTELGNPIYSYTVMLPVLRDDPMLPFVVRARVTNMTIKAPVSSNNISGRIHEHVHRMGMLMHKQEEDNDKGERLVGYILGGPEEPYNFVPQSQRLNPYVHRKGSQWYRMEKYIRNFVNFTGGRAEMTIIVVYYNLPDTTRPDGFVVNVGLYHPNNTLHDECDDKYYSNDPVIKIV